MRLNDVVIELAEVEHHFWFVQRVEIEQTDDAIKARLDVRVGLFIQIFFSEKTNRFNMAS
ncbi:MAG: hypothetical protein FJ010_14530 [Chloroflexi bacterium]|nr:hypothetical protein [Chloroflexota bacterium]